MILSLVSTSAFAADFTKFKVQNGEVSLDGTNPGSVTVAWVGTGNQDVYAVEGSWSTKETAGTSYLTLTAISSDILTFSGMNYVDVPSGKVLWTDDSFSAPGKVSNGVALLKATYKIAANTPAGDYFVTYTSSNLTGDDYNPDGTAKVVTAKITVTRPSTSVDVTSVSLNQNKLNLEVGKTGTLTATVKPDNATDKTVTWTTSDAKVATVANGVVTAVAKGEATITATAGGKTATCKVTVTEPAHKHTPVEVPAQESTCLEKGWQAYYKCSECGAVVDKDGKAAEINYLPLAAHKLTKTDAKAATCTEDGTEAYWTCSVCKKMFSDEKGTKEIKEPVKVPAPGHDIGEKTLETAGDPGKNLALYSATCKNCDKKVYTAKLEMPENTLNVIAKQAAASKKDFSKAVSFSISTPKFSGAPVFAIDPVTTEIVTAAKTEAGYVVAGKINKADYAGGIEYELSDYYDSAEAAYEAMATDLKDGLTFTQTISATENTWTADANSHTMTFAINTKDGTFTVKVDGKDASTITFVNTFAYSESTGGGGGGGNNNTKKDDAKKDDGKKVESGKTFDAGVAMYVGLSVLSVTGGALVIGKKKERF